MTRITVRYTSASMENPPYLERFGLHSPPFLPDVPDDAFLYQDPSFLQRLDLIQHLVRYSDLLLVLTGERGSGKTTLTRQLLARCEGQQTCLVQAHALLGADEILQQIVSCLRIQTETAEADDLGEALGEYLAIQQNSGHPPPLVVVDDAHELPPTTLDALLKLPQTTGRHGKSLRIVLAGEPPITALLTSLGYLTGEDAVYAMELPPLSEEQCAQYLQHRLAAAGLSGPSPFTPPHVRILYQVSGGLPGHLNTAAQQLLTELGMQTKHTAPYGRRLAPLTASLRRHLPPMRQHMTRPPVLAGAAAVLLLGAVLLFQDRINALFTPEPPAPETASLPLPQPQPSVTVARYDTTPTAGGTSGSAPPPAVATSAPEAVAPTVAASQAEDTAPPPAVAATPPAETPAPLPEAAAPDPAPPAQDIAVAPETATPAQAQETTAAVTPPPAAPETKAAQAASPRPAKRDAATGPKRESWLLAQNGNQYTLQLIGSRQESTVLNLIKTHRLGKQASYFRTRYKDDDWYVLLYGIYPSRDAALAAVRKLPQPLQAQKPWARTLKSVHQDIRKAEKTQTNRR